jgi:cell division protein FtsB
MIQKRKKYTNIFNKKTFILLQIIVIVSISVPLAKNISKRYLVNKEITELNKEITELESKNLKLKEVIGYLESDQFIEEQSRLNLGFKKEGEEVIIVDNQNNISGNNSATGDTELPDDSKKLKNQTTNLANLNRWWEYFF